MNQLTHAIKIAGSQRQLADELGIKPRAISMWKTRQRLSAAWRMVLEARYPLAVRKNRKVK